MAAKVGNVALFYKKLKYFIYKCFRIWTQAERSDTVSLRLREGKKTDFLRLFLTFAPLSVKNGTAQIPTYPVGPFVPNHPFPSFGAKQMPLSTNLFPIRH
jgi:hypothetical protein